MIGKPRGSTTLSGHRTEVPDHGKNACDLVLVVPHDRHTLPEERGCDVGLQVGKREKKVWVKSEDLRDIGRREGRYPRFFLSHALARTFPKLSGSVIFIGVARSCGIGV